MTEPLKKGDRVELTEHGHSRRPKWPVGTKGTVTGSKYLGQFRARTAEEAVEMALNSDTVYVSICHQCSGECENPDIHEATADPVEEPTTVDPSAQTG